MKGPKVDLRIVQLFKMVNRPLYEAVEWDYIDFFFGARKDCLVEMEEAIYCRKWVTFWYICTTSLVYRLTAKSDTFFGV